MAWALALASLPLVLFGGTVTTLRAGMAIDGWLVLEPGRGDHFLFFYPVEKWFRDAGTFTEHTHRLIGSLVGVLAIAYVAVTFRLDGRRTSRALALASLLAIVAQGILGGLRVLQNSEDLAFLHGALAQAVLAVLGANLVVQSSTWVHATPSACKLARGTQRTALAALVLVYLQIVLGAWLRHSGASLPLALHAAFAMAVVGGVVGASRRMQQARAAAGADAADRAILSRSARRLQWILGLQVVLGVLATIAVMIFSGGFQGRVSVGEMVFSTLHVLFGALLLVETLAANLWVRRVLCTSGAEVPLGESRLGHAGSAR